MRPPSDGRKAEFLIKVARRQIVFRDFEKEGLDAGFRRMRLGGLEQGAGQSGAAHPGRHGKRQDFALFAA